MTFDYKLNVSQYFLEKFESVRKLYKNKTFCFLKLLYGMEIAAINKST